MIRTAVPKNVYTMKHYNQGRMALTDHDGSPGHPPVHIVTECVTHWPSSVCRCGTYCIDWLKGD